MSDTTAHLVKMANNLSRNLSPGKPEEQAVADIRGHISKFWTVAMQQQLQGDLASQRETLDANAFSAVEGL